MGLEVLFMLPGPKPTTPMALASLKRDRRRIRGLLKDWEGGGNEGNQNEEKKR